MKPRLLIVANPDDALANALLRRLPQSLSCTSPLSTQFSFQLGRDGSLLEWSILLKDRAYDWRQIVGIVFRPGPDWTVLPRLRSLAKVFAFHERSTAWCALLAVFPGPVIDRLPPAWFLDRARHATSLTASLTAHLGVPSNYGVKSSGLGNGVPSEGSVMIVGPAVLAADQRTTSQEFCIWLSNQTSALQAWKRSAGLQFARIDGRRCGANWAIGAVDQTSLPADPSARQIDDWATSLAELLQE